MLSRYVVSQAKQHGFFALGLGLGLWLALVALPLEEAAGPAGPLEPCGTPAAAAAAAAAAASPADDEYAPHLEERPAAPPPAAKQLQRPRYYSTELGIRNRLMAGILTSEAGLQGTAAALNRTAGVLQPRLFMAATEAAAARPRVVGFTDTRKILQPFHALKYLADNYLEEYDFFFLVSDASYVNARRLSELVGGLSVSQDVYMGAVADDDSHYCSLDGGIILSNSVLRAVQTELDWCVRNSYSAHHHENIGRCVLHAAHLPCQPALQGQKYVSALFDESSAGVEGAAGARGGGGGGGAGLRGALREAVTAGPVATKEAVYHLHAYVSRLYLERDRSAQASLGAALAAPPAPAPPEGPPVPPAAPAWPAGLRREPHSAAPIPENRFDHLRWVTFNASHALLHAELAAAPLAGSYRAALDLVLRHVGAWAAQRWGGGGAGGGGGGGGGGAALVEGAWRWAPPTDLTYNLLLRVDTPQGQQLRGVQVVRPLGAARLVPLRYVTESGRLTILLRLPPSPWGDSPLADGGGAGGAAAVRRALQRYSAAAAADKKLSLLLAVPPAIAADASIRSLLADIGRAQPDSTLDVVSVGDGGGAGGGGAVRGAAARAPRAALLLIMDVELEYNEEFLNRVRMNTIAGVQWSLPAPFMRYAVWAHPSWGPAGGAGGPARPQVNTGHFRTSGAPRVLTVYNSDLENALAAHPLPAAAGDELLGVAEALTAAGLQCLRAPEPAALLPPPPRPRAAAGGAAVPAGGAGGAGGGRLELGARHSLAKLLLETDEHFAAL